MHYNIRRTSRFDRDLKKAQRQGQNLDKLKAVIVMLAHGERLDEKYRDHNLHGDYEGYRECHIAPNWLLIYKILGNELILVLSRLGSHADLFNE